MKKDDNTMGSSRRSFMKKSVVAAVAAVAASNMTIFTGLVDAGRVSSYYFGVDCKMFLREGTDPLNGEYQVECFFPQAHGSCQGYCWYWDAGISDWTLKNVSCKVFDHITDYAVCHSLNSIGDRPSGPPPA